MFAYHLLGAVNQGTHMGSETYGTSLIIAVLLIIAHWKIFTKAGKPGWGSLIPFYNLYLVFDIVYGKGWKFLWLIVPIVIIYYAIVVPFKMAKVFGKGFVFGLGMFLLSPIFDLILGFGSATYIGPQR